MSTLEQTSEVSRLPQRMAPDSASAGMALASACAAWMFDAMDLQIFTLILFPTVSELIRSNDPGAVAYTGGVIVGLKLVALGLGGVAFGVAADRVGRAKTMIITVLIYSVFTGLSALAHSWWQLAVLQGLAGIGIGGEWAAGTALVVETWPERTRPQALQIIQMCFAAGFFLAAAINFIIGPMGWRYVFAVGAAPALVTVFVRLFVPEPQRWIAIRDHRLSATRAGSNDTAFASFLSLFAPPIRRRVIVGLSVATSMMIGAFGGATLLPIWVRGLVGGDPKLAVTVTSQCFMLMNVGGVVGYLALMWLNDTIGRRWSFFLMSVGCAAANLFMFTEIGTSVGLLRFAVVYGFFAVGGFGTFAVYLPELFPTRIRASGQGLCWNAARILTAVGPIAIGAIVNAFHSTSTAGATLSVVYLLGLVAIWFGPETRGTPLQD